MEFTTALLWIMGILILIVVGAALIGVGVFALVIGLIGGIIAIFARIAGAIRGGG